MEISTNWVFNSNRYSNGPFFFFWKIFLKKILYKQEFIFFSFLVKILKLLFCTKQKLLNRTSNFFFCFLFVSQLSFSNLKQNNFFLKIWTFFFRNLFAKNRILGNVFLNLFTLTTTVLPNGFFFETNFSYILISKIIFQFSFKILNKNLFLVEIFTKFQQNGKKNDAVSVFWITIFLKNVNEFCHYFFFNYILISKTSIGSIVKKIGKKMSFFGQGLNKKFPKENLLVFNIRFFLLMISNKKRKKIKLIKKFTSFNSNTKKNEKILLSKKYLIYLKSFFKINFEYKKKKYGEKKSKSKHFVKNFFPVFLNNLDPISGFVIFNFLVKKKFFSNFYKILNIFLIWHDHQLTEFWIKQYFLSVYEEGAIFKKNFYLKKIQNLSFEIFCDKIVKKKKTKKNQKWLLDNLNRSLTSLNYLVICKMNLGKFRRNFLILFFEFIICCLNRLKYFIEKFIFFFVEHFLGKIFLYIFSVLKLLIWNSSNINAYFSKKKFFSKFSWIIGNKKFLNFFRFHRKKKNCQFKLYVESAAILSFHFFEDKNAQKWIEKNYEFFTINKWILFFALNKKYLKKKTENMIEMYTFFFILRNQKKIFLIFPLMEFFLKKLNVKKKKKNFINLDDKITEKILYSLIFFRFFALKSQICTMLWNFSPKIFYLLFELVDSKIILMNIKKKIIFTLFLQSFIFVLKSIKKSSKKSFSNFHYQIFFGKKRFLIFKKNIEKFDSKYVRKKKKFKYFVSFNFFFLNRTKGNDCVFRTKI